MSPRFSPEVGGAHHDDDTALDVMWCSSDDKIRLLAWGAGVKADLLAVHILHNSIRRDTVRDA